MLKEHSLKLNLTCQNETTKYVDLVLVGLKRYSVLFENGFSEVCYN